MWPIASRRKLNVDPSPSRRPLGRRPAKRLRLELLEDRSLLSGTGTPNQVYVESVYQLVLGRPADQFGLA